MKLNLEDILLLTKKATTSSLKGYSAKVFLYLLSKDNESLFNNAILASQDDMAKTLDISKSMVALGVKELKEKKIITATRAGRLNIYTFIK